MKINFNHLLSVTNVAKVDILWERAHRERATSHGCSDEG